MYLKMNKCVPIVLLSVLAGCGSLDQVNNNMQQTNELLQQNTRIMTTSLETVAANTQEVKRSTDTMMQFESTIKENSSLIQRILGQLSEHPLFFPIVFLMILLLLLVPSLILYFAFRSLNKALLANRKK